MITFNNRKRREANTQTKTTMLQKAAQSEYAIITESKYYLTATESGAKRICGDCFAVNCLKNKWQK